VQADNKEIVLALREIAAGKVTPAKPKGRLAQEKNEEGK
jgi:DNA-directed RNA polymerase subunit K/omega